MTVDEIRQAAVLLLEARRAGRPLPRLPVPLRPQTLPDAYAIQDAVMRNLGPVGGWKLSAAADPGSSRCTPILASQIFAAPCAVDEAAVPRLEVEVEIAVRFGRDLTEAGRTYAAADVQGAISSLHPSLEVISSRFEDRKQVTALESTADFQNNGGVVWGAGVSDWRGINFEGCGMSLFVNDTLVRTAPGGPPTDVVMAALVHLANHALVRVGGIRAGDIVITGAPHMKTIAIRGGDRVRAGIEGVGSLDVAIVSSGAAVTSQGR